VFEGSSAGSPEPFPVIRQCGHSDRSEGPVDEPGRKARIANHPHTARKVSSPCDIRHRDEQKGDRILGDGRDPVRSERIV
jgi:hypothetical protein